VRRTSGVRNALLPVYPVGLGDHRPTRGSNSIAHAGAGPARPGPDRRIARGCSPPARKAACGLPLAERTGRLIALATRAERPLRASRLHPSPPPPP
jgi:hypothetical protein